jgi:hypothetical protein
MPLVDVFGNEGTVPSAQMLSEVPKSNEGAMFGFTFTVKVVEVAHCPEEGVNVYVPEAWLSTTARLHTPEILLEDNAGNEGTGSPAQIDSDVPKLNVGVSTGFTVTEKLVAEAHCPASGVNRYVPE